jgi:hypothetical protein
MILFINTNAMKKNKIQRRTFISRVSLSALSTGIVASGYPEVLSDSNELYGDRVSGPKVAPQDTLKIYRPKVKHAQIYNAHPSEKITLKYNHDVDIIKFKRRFFAAWNANQAGFEDVPGQFNFLSVSDDFEHWSRPTRMFTKEGAAINPVESDNQWQPNFINLDDKKLFCAWSDFVARRVFVATSEDGLRWQNHEVPNAPEKLRGIASGFPTNHGLITSRGTMLFPCSIPFTDTLRAAVGKTQYAGILISEDNGRKWTWSEPIEAVSWTQAGEDPADFGGEKITLWEPMLFEQADGRIGLLIRNSTAQDNPERKEIPHRMLLYATSSDDGKTWTKARPVEVDTICSRNYALSGINSPDSLLMVMNDHNVRIPQRIPMDRYFLSLYIAPVSNPDLLLPGPVVQPPSGRAYYPNGFAADGKLYIAYTYPPGISCTVVESMPDFSRPFLLPREGRPGLRIENNMAYFNQRQSSLGLILTEQLTLQPSITLKFDISIMAYDGNELTILTLGGKTREGTSIRVQYNEAKKSDEFQIRNKDGNWSGIISFKLMEWYRFQIKLSSGSILISVNNSTGQKHDISVLRKICFGGLYVPPEWPLGTSQFVTDFRLKLDSIKVE